MITKYYRPQSLDEAINLFSKQGTYPMGGGTQLTKKSDTSFAVVDLQNLDLNKIHKSGDKLEIGATSTLSSLSDSPHIPKTLRKVLFLETSINIRNRATVAGTLITCDGRSPFAAVMLALDAKIIFSSGRDPTILGNYLPLRTSLNCVHPFTSVRLVTKIQIPTNVQFAFESIARTAMDRPIVCAALVQWPSGRTRLTLGGYGSAPILALDGNDPGGIALAARNAFIDAQDQWASSEYRSEMAAILAMRCAQEINNS